MANEVVPETTWGPASFGLADARTADVQIRYARELGYPVWGMSPSSTADDTGGYGAFGANGLAFAPQHRLALCPTCASETTVTPHASFLALDVAPHQAVANIETLLRRYPDVYTHDGGFYDALDPVTGSVGHRRLVLDQSMIMAALDNALGRTRDAALVRARPRLVGGAAVPVERGHAAGQVTVVARTLPHLSGPGTGGGNAVAVASW